MAKCKGCGKKIIWAKDRVTGATVPLDPRPPVYVYAETPEGEMQCWRPLAPSAVSHFATCPNANDFSGGRKRKKAD
jgi:hypothetical protein